VAGFAEYVGALGRMGITPLGLIIQYRSVVPTIYEDHKEREHQLSWIMDWKLFSSTFALIFISELPDKTAFASLLLASRNRPLPVFCGAAGAFVVQSVVAVTFGTLLTFLPEKLIHVAAALLFLALAVFMWRRGPPAGELNVQSDVQKQFVPTMVSAFVVIFIAEWGDLTQLATAALAAKYAAPLTIFTSATLALWAVTALSVLIGHTAKRIVQPKLLQQIAAITFALVGIGLLLSAY
jgi:putative Ca2+/H+ antiporter (TMEM165/GDT1 family)